MTGEKDSKLEKWRLRLIGLAVVVFGVALVAVPFWAPRALSGLAFFSVREVEVQGVRYASVPDLVDALGVDTTRSVWDDTGPLVQRLESHPQVRRARIGRRLPSTLVVEVTEDPPLALVAANTGLEVVGESGIILPLDPSRFPINLPVIPAADSGILRLLTEVRRDDQRLFRRISEARRTGDDEFLLRLSTVTVRTRASVSAQRLADAVPVELDLRSRGIVPTELDLRFSQQVIARLP